MRGGYRALERSLGGVHLSDVTVQVIRPEGQEDNFSQPAL